MTPSHIAMHFFIAIRIRVKRCKLSADGELGVENTESCPLTIKVTSKVILDMPMQKISA